MAHAFSAFSYYLRCLLLHKTGSRRIHRPAYFLSHCSPSLYNLLQAFLLPPPLPPALPSPLFPPCPSPLPPAPCTSLLSPPCFVSLLPSIYPPAPVLSRKRCALHFYPTDLRRCDMASSESVCWVAFMLPRPFSLSPSFQYSLSHAAFCLSQKPPPLTTTPVRTMWQG